MSSDSEVDKAHVMMRHAAEFNQSIVHEVAKRAVHFLVQCLDKALAAAQVFPPRCPLCSACNRLLTT